MPHCVAHFYHPENSGIVFVWFGSPNQPVFSHLRVERFNALFFDP
jgi:hypothetical protein